MMWPPRVRLLPAALGGAAGIAVAVVIIATVSTSHETRSTGRILSECDGQLRQLVIQYESSAREISLPVYRSFLPQLPPDVTVHVLCPDDAAWQEFVQAVGAVHCQLRPRLAGHAMTSWSRDRWLCLRNDLGQATLLCPPSESAGEIWPQRQGDERVAFDLARQIDHVTAERSRLYFDGGDVMADSRQALVMGRALQRNLAKAVATPEEFRSRMQSQLGLPVTVLTEAPDHHAAMFMMSAGDGVMLVGDIRLAEPFIAAGPASAPAGGAADVHDSLATETLPGVGESSPSPAPSAVAAGPARGGLIDVHALLPGGADQSDQMRDALDAVAARCEQLGYRVVRIPLLPGRDGRTYITYLNAILDQRDGGRTIYMPTYQGADPLNAAAARVWQSVGYTVKTVDCTTAYRHFGCLHCLVNVLER